MNGFILKGKGYPRTPKYAHGESHIQVMFTLLKSCNMKRLTFLPSLEEDLCCAMNYPTFFTDIIYALRPLTAAVYEPVRDCEGCVLGKENESNK